MTQTETEAAEENFLIATGLMLGSIIALLSSHLPTLIAGQPNTLVVSYGFLVLFFGTLYVYAQDSGEPDPA